jgi:type I restriction enzyme S subunit
LSRPLKRSDLGNEVGSINYIGQSPFYFLRTKALQSHTYLPEITPETALPIMPKAFIKTNLKEGDLLISKDSNIGEIVILEKDYPSYMTSGAIYKLPVTQNKYYLLAFIKHQIFREQLDFMVPKGATIRHAKTMFLDCKIPMPNKKSAETIKFIEVLTKAIISKEKLIKERHRTILNIFEKELSENQKPNKFQFTMPTLSEINKVGRLDTSRYSSNYKRYEFLIKNYVNGSFKLSDYGYFAKRGQNLQISNIGQSFYSNDFINGFYKLAVSSNFSEYSTVEKFMYLGNPKNLTTILEGDIIFSARGAQFGRVVVFPEKIKNTITNIDSLVIQSENCTLTRSIFIAMFLNILRWNKHIYYIAITGSGANSLTQYQSDDINFPNFPSKKQKEIATLYHNANVSYKVSKCNLDNFIQTDLEFNMHAGIYELDKTAKQLKVKLNQAIDDIINDREVRISFDD